MATMALTLDGNLHARFFIEMGRIVPEGSVVNEFDYWLDGAPVMETGEDGEFSDWIDDSPFEDL